MKDSLRPLLLLSWFGFTSVRGFVRPESGPLGTKKTGVINPISLNDRNHPDGRECNNSRGGYYDCVVWKKKKMRDVDGRKLWKMSTTNNNSNDNEVEDHPFFSKEVPYGEESRKYRRTVYNADLWLLHRAPERFFHNLIGDLFTSGIVRQLLSEVSAVTAIAFLCCLWNVLTVDGFTGIGSTHYEPIHLPIGQLVLPTIPFSLSTSALGLLLVFRTNTAYFRWNEARSAWGKTINHSRNIMRMSSSWTIRNYQQQQNGSNNSSMSEEELEALLQEMAVNIWTVPRSMTRHFLSESEDEVAFRAEVMERLSEEDASKLIAARHRPQRALYQLTHSVRKLPLDFRQRMQIDESLTVLIDMIGTCERLFTAPIPLFYTRHTARFLSTWLLLLPFSLYEPFGNTWNHWLMVPASSVISFFFFGIEELAIQLEEPFSILPMAQMTEGIGLSAQEMADWHQDEKQIDTDSYFWNQYNN